MGNTFNNISILKNGVKESMLKNHIIRYMQDTELYLCADATDECFNIVIKNNPASRWITLYSDEADFELTDQLAQSIAKKLKATVMFTANVDSDYMILHLCSPKEDDTVCIGEPYEMLEMDRDTHGNPKAWKRVAKDTTNLMHLFAEEYVLPEEILVPLEEEIGICAADINMTVAEALENSADEMVLHFTYDTSAKFFITEGPTLLECVTSDEPVINELNMACFVNRGGVSKGVAVMISGAFVEKDEAMIDEIELNRAKNPREEIDWENNIVIAREKTEKGVTASGKPVYYAHFPEFRIPEGVNGSCSHLLGEELQDAEFSHEIIVRFTPKGPDWYDISDMQVILQPLTYQNGTAETVSWRNMPL